ncbi:MAG: hypothetical protein NZ581_02500 [Candidatus Caldarchaeum sp.]|nr:hypothetical protein [Candidatus Caldarchaeum sp.]MDW8435055.1 hypothetical protein [Candidatus Caldarchaeum sp.]
MVSSRPSVKVNGMFLMQFYPPPPPPPPKRLFNVGIVVALLIGLVAGALATFIVTDAGAGGERQAFTTTVVVTRTVAEGQVTTTPEGVDIVVKIGEKFKNPVFELTITKIEKAKYLLHEETYFKPKKDGVILIVSMKAKNMVNQATDLAFAVQEVVLVTAGHGAYLMATPFSELSEVDNVSEDVKKEAKPYVGLETEVEPGQEIEATLTFVVPSEARPAVLYLTILQQGLESQKIGVSLS